MRISQTLRKPANWQDFESLCLMLWREEWNSDDLKKNGRTGQSQHGVDISGHRDGEDEYSGIQCKCKSDGEVLTKEEVAAEIKKAVDFKPSLKRYVIATTAKKDAALEEFVRIQDVENRGKGLFSIDVKAWEDIVDMMERHKRVLLQYQGQIEEDSLATVSFDSRASTIEIRPKYWRVSFIAPAHESIPEREASKLGVVMPKFSAMASALGKTIAITPRFSYVPKTRETNLSFVPLKIMVTNEGTSPLDNIKLELFFDCSGIKFTHDNVEEKGGVAINRAFMARLNSNIDFDGQTVVLTGATLNPKDKLISDDFFIKVPFGTERICVHWKLLSRYYNESGELSITVNSVLKETTRVDVQCVGETYIEDYIVIKEL